MSGLSVDLAFQRKCRYAVKNYIVYLSDHFCGNTLSFFVGVNHARKIFSWISKIFSFAPSPILSYFSHSVKFSQQIFEEQP